MNVINLCSGINIGALALKGRIHNYYSCEIDKHANAISQYNFPRIKQLGDLTLLEEDYIKSLKIDVVLCGSPCQSFSRLGDGSGFDGKSKLFFDCLRITKWCKEINPNLKFMYENVKMKKEWIDIITQNLLNVDTTYVNYIDSKYFSAQTRSRVYWTNFEVDAYSTNDLVIQDIIGDVEFTNPPNYLLGEYCGRQRLSMVKDVTSKTGCLTASMWRGQINSYCKRDNLVYKYTPNDCEAFQTLPIDFTKFGNYDGEIKEVCKSKRFEVIGNGWTVDGVKHILQQL